MTRTLADKRHLRIVHRALGGRSRPLLLVPIVLLIVLGASYLSRSPSVWIENRSSQQAVVFVTDDSARPAAWYVVPPHTTIRAGSDGLGSPDVRANVLGWRHEADHLSRCAPGDYHDTIPDVPRGASVRLLIDETGQPSVSLAPEPPNLTPLPQAPLGNLSEAGICAATGG